MLQFNKKQIKKTHKEVVSSVKNLSKPEQIQELRDQINAELDKLPKRKRKKMQKLAEAYINGKVLRPNENIDNKRFMLEGS